ncbi:hypothetical protein Kompost2_00003 [Pseudomonas phage vB_PpuP-Kompost-2]
MTRPSPDITARLVSWAKQHDWYSSSNELITGTTIKYYRVVVRDNSSTMGIRYFENFKELRNWAGY